MLEIPALLLYVTLAPLAVRASISVDPIRWKREKLWFTVFHPFAVKASHVQEHSHDEVICLTAFGGNNNATVAVGLIAALDLNTYGFDGSSRIRMNAYKIVSLIF